MRNESFFSLQEYVTGWYILQELKPAIQEQTFDNNMNTHDLLVSNGSASDNDSVISFANKNLNRDQSVDISANIIAKNEMTLSGIAQVSLNSKDQSQMRSDEGRFASMQRPEPLGKAKAEGRLAAASPESYVSGTTKTRSGANSPAFTAGDDVIAGSSSDEGLNEQEFPIRVPLSVAEGDNSVGTKTFGSQEANADDGVKVSPESKTEALFNSVDKRARSDFDASNVMHMLQNSHGLDKSEENALNAGNIEAATNLEPETPIAALLEPTYKSSVALLEELKRRRLQFDKITANVGNKDNPMPDNDINPLKLADNAMKASNILSSRTAKSLKKASLVLKAVEEHRSPPTDLSRSLSLEQSKTMNSDRSSNAKSFDVSFTTSRSSKDSIDKLIEARIKKINISSESSSLNKSSFHTQADSDTAKSLYTASTSSDGLNKKSSKASGIRDYSRKSKSRSPVSHLTETSERSSLSDVTASELMRLEEVTEEFDSPATIAIADRFKSQTDNISPIERHNILPVTGNKNFRSSSRIRGSRAARHRSDLHLTDSEIVQMHRSLGAGTVTPLPIAKDDSGGKRYPIEPSYTSSSSGVDIAVVDNSESLSSSRSASDGLPKLKRDSTTENGENSIESDCRTVSHSLDAKEPYQRPMKGASVSQKFDGGIGSAFRGIYDIRDSTGPGSTNRRRMLVGKQPSRPKSDKKDPLDVYVTEESKSEVSFVSEKGYKQKIGEEQAVKTSAVKAKQEVVKENIASRDQTFSSMSSEFPVLSYEDMSVGREVLQHSTVSSSSGERFASRTSAKNAQLSFNNERKELSSRRFPDDDQNVFKYNSKQRWVNSAGVLSTRHKDLNQLWEKFKKDFDKDHGRSSNEVIEKIQRLNELLDHNGAIKGRKSAEGQESARPISSSEKGAQSSKALVSKQISSKANEQNQPRCPNCGKRDAQTNCPTPIPFDAQAYERSKGEPLLLHMWTQTTPHAKAAKQLFDSSKALQKTSNGIKSVPAKFQQQNTTQGTSIVPEKENIQLEANSHRMQIQDEKNRSDGKTTSSWNVVFEEKRKLEGIKNVLTKPPVPQIAKDTLNHEFPKKKKQPVFTAWFQSTRSDTSSGTVVPLSTVPKLADAYKENKRAPKMMIKDINPKETE